MHKKHDHLMFLLACQENKKEIERMKSFDACFENEGLNRDDGIFFSNISSEIKGEGVTCFLFYRLDLI